MTSEFKKIKDNEDTRYVLETATAGATSAGVVATAPGKKREDSILAQEAGKEKDAPKPRNFVAKNAKMGGAGKMKDKSKTIPRKEKHKKPVAEGFNGEYDDEAGMAHNNLLTSARAVMGLLKTIEDKDNLPEWVQEKIAKAEMMLVGVWDYLQSQKEQGIDPQQDANEAYGRYDRRDAYQRDYDNSISGFHSRRGEIDDEANLMYIYRDGRVKQRMVSNHEERDAKAEGFRDSIEKALKVHNIIRSKFDPKKWVQKQGTQWVQVFPFGEPKDVAESETYMETLDKLLLDVLQEKAPPGDKYERMVKHIKKGYSKDGKLSDKEKSIAYATAWKAKNKAKK